MAESLLESIVINSGRSLIRAAGSFSEGDINAQSGTDNISWRDLAAYVDSYPLVQDLEIDLGVSGSLSEMTVSMHARAEGNGNASVCAYGFAGRKCHADSS